MKDIARRYSFLDAFSTHRFAPRAMCNCIFFANIVVLLFTLFAGAGCGTISTFKTAKLTKDNGVEFTAGLTYQNVRFQHAAEDAAGDVIWMGNDESSIVAPDFSFWTRLGRADSRYDAGFNFAVIPFSFQGTVRRHVFEQRGIIPETSIGLSYRKYSPDSVVGDAIYYSEYSDVGIPIYISWSIMDNSAGDLYTKIMPLQRKYEYEGSSIGGDRYNHTERFNTVQFSLGMRFYRIMMEWNVVPLAHGLTQIQIGTAYLFY